MTLTRPEGDTTGTDGTHTKGRPATSQPKKTHTTVSQNEGRAARQGRRQKAGEPQSRRKRRSAGETGPKTGGKTARDATPERGTGDGKAKETRRTGRGNG